MLSCDLVVDIGSSFVTIYQKGLGVVLKEPSIAVVVTNGKKNVIKASGTKARTLIGKTVAGEQIFYPFKDGAIVNSEVAYLLIKDFLHKILGESIMRQKLVALVPVSCGLSLAERRAYDSLFQRLGFSESIVVDSPNAVNMLIPDNSGIVVNIGASLSEFATVAETGIINGYSLNIAGDNYTKALMDYLEERCSLKVGYFTAEKIKHTVMSLYPNDTSACEVTGRDYIGTPKTVTVRSSDLYEIASTFTDNIAEVIKTTVSYLPPEMTEDVMNKGIYICGGTAKMPGIAEYVSKAIGLNVNVLQDPENAVVNGGAKLLANRAVLNEILDLKNL